MFDVRARRVKVVRLMRVYLDHNATTRLVPEARTAMLEWLDSGNPSSIHAEGRLAREAVERARDAVAALVGASRDEIVFTSGGTESNNQALRGMAETSLYDEPRHRLILSPLEHPSVDDVCAGLMARGFETWFLDIDSDGVIDLDDAVKLTRTQRPYFVTVQLANHELGTIQPVAEIARLTHEAGAFIHVDAVQAAGKIPVDAHALGVDTLAISAHKIGGPKGVGALYVRRGFEAASLMMGGHQERELRPGTENVAAIVGFGAAAVRARAGQGELAARGKALRDRLEAGMVAAGARVHGGGARVGNTTNVGFDGVDGELLVAALDLEGVAASTGAACSSGSLEPSPVVTRLLGNDRVRAKEAVRFSLGWDTRAEDIDYVLSVLPSLVARIRAA
jgi:cysteine desulfurase